MSSAFVFRAKEVNHTLVYLDAGVDSALLEQLSERSATAGLLIESLVEKDNTGDVVIESGISGEQKLKRKEKNMVNLLTETSNKSVLSYFVVWVE